MIIKIPVRNADATDKPKVTFVAVANILSAMQKRSGWICGKLQDLR